MIEEPISTSPDRHWSWFLRQMTYAEVLAHEAECRREHEATGPSICRATDVWLGEARAYIPVHWWAL